MAAEVSGSVKAGGFTKVVTASFQRPNDTTQYTANDVVSSNTSTTNALVFKDCARVEGGTGIIYSAIMFDSVAAGTKPSFDLVLFDNATITMAGDNSAGTVTDLQIASAVAVITFDGTSATNVSIPGPNCMISVIGFGQGFQCAAGSRNLYGVVVDRAGYTPSALEIFTFKLTLLQD